MDKPATHAFTLPTLGELRALAEVSSLRLPLQEAESRRVSRVREAAAAGSELSRCVAAHAHALLADCQGSRGTADLDCATLRLHAARARYSGLVSALVRDQRRYASATEAGSAEMLLRSELVAHHGAGCGDGQAPLEWAV